MVLECDLGSLTLAFMAAENINIETIVTVPSGKEVRSGTR
jgi:hypothetical protein